MIAWTRTQKQVDDLRRVRKNGTEEEFIAELEKQDLEKKKV